MALEDLRRPFQLTPNVLRAPLALLQKPAARLETSRQPKATAAKGDGRRRRIFRAVKALGAPATRFSSWSGVCKSPGLSVVALSFSRCSPAQMQLFNTSQGFCAENNSLQNLASPRFYYFSFISEQLVRVFVHSLPSRPRREFGGNPPAATYAPRATTTSGGGQRATLALGNGDKKKTTKNNKTPNFVPRLDRSRCKMLLSLLRLPERGVNRSQVHSKHPRRIPAPLEDFFFFFFPFFFFFSPPSADQSRKFSWQP